MTDYHKYMFDDFVVKNRKEESSTASEELEENMSIATPTDESLQEAQDKPAEVEENYEDFTSDSEVIKQDKIIETSYSREDIEEAVRKAAEEAYQQGKEETMSSLVSQQNKLLEDIRNQLMAIFSTLNQKETEYEEDALKLAVSALRKVFPTIETQAAEAEIKKFLSENFSSVSGQDMLSFSFNPESISLVANSLGKFAEQNDFEGKIAVHKDASLGPSDCKIEWKDGRVERKATDFINKVENLIETEKQERENGE